MAGSVPAFSASLVTVLGDGQQLNLAATGSTANELAIRVGLLREMAQSAITAHNKRVLDAVDTVQEAQERATARGIRAWCHATGVPVPIAFRDDPPANGHDAQEGATNADDDPDRADDAAVHPRARPQSGG